MRSHAQPEKRRERERAAKRGKRDEGGKGPYLYDVRTEGEGGGCPKCDDSTDKLREYDIDKGEGVGKNQTFCGRHGLQRREGVGYWPGWTDGRTSKNKIALLSLSQIGGPDSGGGNGGTNMRTRMP